MTTINQAMAEQLVIAQKAANSMIKRANDMYKVMGFKITSVEITDLAFGDKGLTFTISRGDKKSSIEVGQVDNFKTFESTAEMIDYLKNTRNQFTRMFKEHIQYYATSIFTAEKLVEDLKGANELRKDFVFRIGNK